MTVPPRSIRMCSSAAIGRGLVLPPCLQIEPNFGFERRWCCTISVSEIRFPPRSPAAASLLRCSQQPHFGCPSVILSNVNEHVEMPQHRILLLGCTCCLLQVSHSKCWTCRHALLGCTVRRRCTIARWTTSRRTCSSMPCGYEYYPPRLCTAGVLTVLSALSSSLLHQWN